jgi:glycosyltransferase involved in cell wall biosynthesis
MKVSIAIPTWESHGRGGEFLDDLFRTIEIQTFKDFEVCISDHSMNDDVLNVVNEYTDKFEIVFRRNSNNRGNGPANTNASIDLCSGEIIKIMFQDDFFYDDESLEKIVSEFENSDKAWLVNACNHTKDDGHSFYWDFYPQWNDKILHGVNTISSPSVLSIKKEVFKKVKFDTSLVMMMDCDYYYNAREQFGDPIYYHDVLVSNRVHKNQISMRYDKNLQDEVDYCLEKYQRVE